MPQIPILPQQPNYTIHTSQAPTTSRVPTQTADFSEAEESIDSDDSYDRLPWHEVSGRGKERTRPRTTKLPTIRKNKTQETNNHSTQLTITNRFKVLRDAETEGSSKQKRPFFLVYYCPPAPTPIFIPEATNMQRLTATIEQAVNR
jgi:hypothetical protein